MSWEYKTIRSDRDSYRKMLSFGGGNINHEKFCDEINVLGAEGWELVGPGMNDGVNAMILVFKRPKKS